MQVQYLKNSRGSFWFKILNSSFSMCQVRLVHYHIFVYSKWALKRSILTPTPCCLSAQPTFLRSKSTLETLEKRSERCPKLTIKTPERRHLCHSFLWFTNYVMSNIITDIWYNMHNIFVKDDWNWFACEEIILLKEVTDLINFCPRNSMADKFLKCFDWWKFQLNQSKLNWYLSSSSLPIFSLNILSNASTSSSDLLKFSILKA